MDHTFRRLLTLGFLLGAPLALAQSSSSAQACWARDVERIDYLQNPPEGGDNDFFTGVSDQSVALLKSFAGLKSLNLYHTTISENGVQALKAALPQCEIVWQQNSGLPNRRGS